MLQSLTVNQDSIFANSVKREVNINHKSDETFDVNYHPWYSEVLKLNDAIPNGSIHWFVDRDGNMGKTKLANFMSAHLDGKWTTERLLNINIEEIAIRIINLPDKGWTGHGIIFDLNSHEDMGMRGYNNLINLKYGEIETRILKMKFVPPVIIIFSDFYPDKKKVRSNWNVYEINDGKSNRVENW